MQYDEVGNLIAYTREDGTVIEYVYDDVNRVSEVSYPALPGVAADTITYTYDELYRLTNQSDNDSAIDYAFDPISRLTSTTQTWNSQADTLSFAYDLIDRRIGMTDATGASTYVYDDLDRMTGLTDSAARAFGFAYDPLDRLTRKIMANGTATDFTYDPASQLLDIITEKVSTSEVIESIAYTYNTTGTRSSETRLDGNARSFIYDANDRVTQVINSQLPTENELFAYDRMGNWTTDSRQHNTENELTQDSSYVYQYDELGNMILRQSLSDPADQTTYTWDARNLLIAVDGPVNDTSYAYDARNRRVAKTVNSITTQYVHDGLNILLEYDGAGNLLARNTHAGLDQLCVRDEVAASTAYYVCQDGISSVLSVSDENGNTLQRYRYSAFGEQQVLDANFNLVTDAPLIPFAYTGREWEPEVGMYFYRARFYDAELGRFISRDPLGLDGGDVNLYAYVGNNPINYWDPLGLSWYNNWHLNRNKRNQPVTPQEANDQDWVKMSPDKAIYHSMGAGNEDNEKFVSPDGKSEAVFRSDGSVVTDPANMATYNYSSPNKFFGIGHFFADVIPYYMWGNAEDDPTTGWERLTASYEGDKDPSH
jgi:RHS repeat-associated protein